MITSDKSLLVRADFVLGNQRGGNRVTCKRWRRALALVLPQLLGIADRSPKVRVRLHKGEGEAKFTAWLRIPVKRRPGRKRLRLLKAKLRGRLEAGLLLIDGRVVKLGARRCRARAVEHSEELPALLLPSEALEINGPLGEETRALLPPELVCVCHSAIS